MCFGWKQKKKRFDEEKLKESPAQPDHKPGPGPGMWPVRPLRPLPNEVLQAFSDGSNYVKHKKFSEPDGNSTPCPKATYDPNPLPNSDDKKESKKASAFDQKAASQDTRNDISGPSLHYTHRPTQQDLDLDDPITRSEFQRQRHPPPSGRSTSEIQSVGGEQSSSSYLVQKEFIFK